MTTGYSDRVNHALAFAAKHHDQQVRAGARPPYQTQSGNVAVILCRYAQDDDMVVSGILLNVVEDSVRAHDTRETLSERIGEKFGDAVLAAALDALPRARDDDGIPLLPDDARAEFLERLVGVGDRSRLLCAADALHTTGSIVADLQRTEFPESVWERYRMGRERTLRWYRQLADRLSDVGFDAPILDELRASVAALESAAADSTARSDATGVRR